MVNLSLERGNSDGSCCAYVWLGRIAGSVFGNYKAGFRFGRLGYELVEQRGLKRFQARTYVSLGYQVLPWTKHVRAGRGLLRRAFEAANKTGDLTFAAYSCQSLNANLLAAGDPLVEVQREAEIGLEFAQKARFGFVIDIIAAQLGLIRALRGLTPKFGSFNDEQFDELLFERHLASDTRLAPSECKYWIRKLQARYFAGDYVSALDASLRAQRLLWTSPAFFETAEYHFYDALCHAASCDSASPDRHQQHFKALAAHYRQLEIWAENGPENFETRVALVGAEIARIEGRDLDAMRLYEQAIRSAHTNSFIHDEALANELAARFYAARGFEKIARVYLQDARYGYLRWGADGKVRQLEEMYPDLRAEEPASAPTSTIGAQVEHLDLATVLKVSQAVSSEIVLEKLIDTLMRTAIAQAGAERGLLILPHGVEQRIAAEATTEGDTVIVRLREAPITAAVLPETVLHYLLRTRESVILDDAVTEPRFAADPYIRQRQARSILCLPLVNQAKLTGVLYLENNLTPCVFAPARIAVLTLLASLAAISLENTRLYRDLAEREAKIRRLVDANIVGIFLWEIEGRILDANDAFLRIVGYDRGDLAAGRMRWTDLTPPDWLDREAPLIQQREMTGRLQPFEKEYFRKDGSRVPVLIGVASFEESKNQGVAFVVDLTERKFAEQALRESEERWRTVFENNPTMYFMLDATNTIVSVNPFGAEQLGYTVDELVGHTVLDLVHEADRDAMDRNVAACFEQLGRTMAWEFRKLRKDGTMLWVRETARAMLIKHSPVVLMVCEDVTERKRAEYLTRQVFESSPDRVCIVGRDYRYQQVNPAFARRWGLPAAAIVGMHVADFVGAENFEQTTKGYLDQCFAGEEVSYAVWLTLSHGRRYLTVTNSPLRPDSERVESALVIIRDLTEHMQASEALREAQRQLAHANRVTTMGQLTASIAHEVNQPIAAAVINAQAGLRWLSVQPPDFEQVRQALGRIVENGNRAGEVVGRIRALIKKEPPRKDGVAMNDAIREVIALTRGEVAKHGAAVQTQLAEGLPLIEGDRVQLQQVILNLIINAVEAMGGVGEGRRELLISTGIAESGDVRVAVRDSGPGLDSAKLDRLFEAFYTTKRSGMGMGLSICRSIVEAHGGRLWAEANDPRGAIFQFTVPAHL
jgi:PAS domain S-box-containing protein